jgi:hypothetical protein
MALVAMVSIHPADARPSADNNVMVLGVGVKSCGTWARVRSLKNTEWWTLMAWAQGFITSVNMRGPGSEDITKGTDSDGVAAWIDNYCQQHPLHPLAKAVDALVDELTTKTDR